MDGLLKRLGTPLTERSGFVLPVVIFGLLIMGVVVVAAFHTAGDEQRSSRAVRESSAAFYAAEAGLNDIWGQWDDSLVSDLAPGQQKALGPFMLGGGSSFTITIRRTDNDPTDTQRSFHVAAEGNAPGGAASVLSYSIVMEPSGGYHLGFCCNAAATVRGDLDVYPENNSLANLLTGVNQDPAGWGAACDTAYDDKPAVIIEDSTQVRVHYNSDLEGDLVEQELPADIFDSFGDYTWDEIKNMADHIVDATDYPSAHWENDGLIHPYYTTDPVTGAVTCDTSTPLNWGSDDPSDPCFDYFPVILIRGEVDVHNMYGQAVVILDYGIDPVSGAKYGAEFDIENGAVFNGIVLGKGCLEIEDGGVFHGAVFVDGTWDYDTGSSGCGADRDLDINDDGDLIYSQCAVDRALSLSKLNIAAEENADGATKRLSRSFSQRPN